MGRLSNFFARATIASASITMLFRSLPDRYTLGWIKVEFHWHIIRSVTSMRISNLLGRNAMRLAAILVTVLVIFPPRVVRAEQPQATILTRGLKCVEGAHVQLKEILDPKRHTELSPESRFKLLGPVLRDCPDWSVYSNANIYLFWTYDLDNDRLPELLNLQNGKELVLYKIGHRWDRFVPTDFQISADPQVNFLVTHEFMINEGSSFYLGEFAGRHVFATNSHILPDEKSCKGFWIRNDVMPGKNSTFQCKEVIARYPDIDLALFTSTDPDTLQAEFLKTHKLQFDFSKNIPSGTRLLTVGHGLYRLMFSRPNKNKMYPSINLSEECVLGEDTATARKISDPDAIGYDLTSSVWSIPHGCETSHGDSGSPLINAKSLRVVGINWSMGNFKPKNLEYKSMTAGQRWELSSMAVPAWKIREKFVEILDSGQLDDKYLRLVLTALTYGN